MEFNVKIHCEIKVELVFHEILWKKISQSILPLKECKYIEKKVTRDINDNLSDFSSSDESDEESVKAG